VWQRTSLFRKRDSGNKNKLGKGKEPWPWRAVLLAPMVVALPVAVVLTMSEVLPQFRLHCECFGGFQEWVHRSGLHESCDRRPAGVEI
jgi:hypothetical protein